MGGQRRQRGPHGSRTCHQSAGPVVATEAVIATFTPAGLREFWDHPLASVPGRVGVSADVGPDLLVPWRKPTTLILYSSREIEPRELGAVEAETRDHANVLVRVPDDRSVFPTHRITAQLDGRDVELADVTQLLWDLLQLGGEDRRDTAERLRSWLLRL